MRRGGFGDIGASATASPELLFVERIACKVTEKTSMHIFDKSKSRGV